MKIFRQRILACILAALIFAGAAVGKDIPVQATGRAGDAPSGILVVYFSCTENTKAVAEHAADILKADIYEIVPEVPYTPEDLNYGNSSSRTSLENNDPDARPGISGSVENMAGYGTVLIGYPIWHGKAPKIIYTFLESYDFSGKTILPFCTSASSPLGTSASNLHALCDPSAKWLDGKRFGAGTSRETVESWLSDMGIPSPDEGECEHSYTEEVTAEPTCTAEGQKTYTCSLCGDSYTVSMPAAGHQPMTDAAVAAGCTAEGKTEGSHCAVCNAVIVEQERIPAAGHQPVTDAAVAAGCTTEGKTEGSHCAVCNAVIVEQERIPAAGHQPVTDASVAAGCTTEGKTEGSHCAVCNAVIVEQERIPASGHHYRTGLVPATMQRDGSVTRICASCRAVDSRKAIPRVQSIKLSKVSYTYNGKIKKPGVTVTDSRGGILKERTDYTLAYPQNAKNAGVYKINIQFTGNYSGTVAQSFTIIPQSVSISKLSPQKGGFSVKWKKQKQNLSGYEISYSTSRKFTKKTTRSVTSGKGGATSKYVTKLKVGKKYYVRLRAFRTVKEGGKSKRLYSSWSKQKNVTVKK